MKIEKIVTVLLHGKVEFDGYIVDSDEILIALEEVKADYTDLTDVKHLRTGKRMYIPYNSIIVIVEKYADAEVPNLLISREN